MPKVKCPLPSCEFDTDNLDSSIVNALVTTHAMVHNTPPEANNAIKVEQVTQPTISAGSTNKDWIYFECRWKDYVEATKVTGKELITQLLECCDETLRCNLTRSAGGSLIDESPDDVLKAIRILAVREKNPMVARNKLNNMSQGIEETVRSFGVRLQEQAGVCNFTIQCACCDLDVDYTDAILHDVLIRGLNDPETQLDLLDEQNQNMSLEEVFLFVEAKEAKKRSALKRLDTQGQVGSSMFRQNKNSTHTTSKDEVKYEMDTEQTAETSVQINNASDNTNIELPPSSTVVETDMAVSAKEKHSTSISVATQGGELASSLYLHNKYNSHTISKFGDKYESDTENTSETSVQDHNVSDKEEEEEIISSPITVQTPMDISEKAKSHVCNICDKAFVSKSVLGRHMIKHTLPGEMQHQCKVCENTFISRSELICHTKLHTGESPNVCEFCDKSFSTSYHLIKHIAALHKDQKWHVCHICSIVFSELATLKQHMSVHKADKQQICNICGKVISTRRLLLQHMTTHTGAKSYVCKVCSRTFARLPTLNQHMKTHTGEKPFLCNICGKAFSLKAGLNVHMATHTGEKGNQCDYCDKSFCRSSDLKRHMIIHTGDKPCICNFCGKAFLHTGNLNRHMTVHTGEKRHICKLCNKAFSSPSTLTDHMVVHTGVKRHVCKICGNAFTRSSHLSRHMRNIHKAKKATKVFDANVVDAL